MAVPAQPGIPEGVPPVARHIFFDPAPAGADASAIKESLTRLAPPVDGSDAAVGIGPSLVHAPGVDVPGPHEFPDRSSQGVQVPSGPLWCWLRGCDLGDLLHVTCKVPKALAPAFGVRHVVDAFRHPWRDGAHGRDVAGVEDGTENPVGEPAGEAAVAQGLGDGLDGSSCVAGRQWVHGLDAFEARRRRVARHDDGIVDAMFKRSRPVSGACFWWPPMPAGRLDLRRMGLGV